jgi:hypothetical protein
MSSIAKIKRDDLLPEKGKDMKTLKQLQEQMQGYVLYNDSDVIMNIADARNINIVERLDVYRDAYYLRLIEILTEDYASLQKLMGEDAFEAMAHDYLDQYPSDSFTIRNVGRNLADYLKNHEGCDPFYAEYAAFEWALSEVLFIEDQEILTLEALSQVSPESWPKLKLQLHNSCCLLQFNYDIYSVYQALESDEEGPDLDFLEQEQGILIWRFDNEALFMPLELAELKLLQAIRNRIAFAECCEMMLEFFSEDEVVSWVANTLQKWIVKGIFSVDLIGF